MTVRELEQQLLEARETITVLQDELAETNHGLLVLNMELEQRVEERTAELAAAHAELKRTNSELLQLTLELEDRVRERTEELLKSNAALEAEIAERKRAEEEVRRLNADLERRVRERTAELEAANGELEAFSYSVSHDLRAPLRHVQGYIELFTRVAEDRIPEKARRYLDIIMESADEMAHLIDDLLAFSRMGRAEIRQSRVDLDSLVHEVVQGLEANAGERAIAWKIAPLPNVVADPMMLKLAIVNLLDNAVKYTRRRNPAEIEVGVGGAEDDKVVIFVRDNGVGFDMQYADKLFGVFQRLHRAEEFEGTGIGLANVRRIISRHGGRTWGEGAVDRGATFYFTLNPASSEGPPPNKGPES